MCWVNISLISLCTFSFNHRLVIPDTVQAFIFESVQLRTDEKQIKSSMRHGDKQNNLGRKKAHRIALLRNLASELIMHKRIVTTLAKAKALRIYVEPLITKTKKNASEAEIMHQHRTVFAYLNDKTAVK